MRGRKATRLPSMTMDSNVKPAPAGPFTWIVSGVTDCGSTGSLNVKMIGWSRATPAMFGRLNPARTIGSLPLPPPPPQDAADTASAASETVERVRRRRVRIGGGSYAIARESAAPAVRERPGEPARHEGDERGVRAGG